MPQRATKAPTSKGYTLLRKPPKVHYSRWQRESVSPETPLPTNSHRHLAEHFGAMELLRHDVHEMLKRRGVTEKEQKLLVRAIAAGYREGWCTAHCERDDDLIDFYAPGMPNGPKLS